MKRPTVLVGLGSGREAWLEVDLDSVRFLLVIENGKRTEEVLTVAELKTRLPRAANLAAEVLAQAVRSDG